MIWPNILAHLTIWLESAQLSSLIFFLYSNDAGYTNNVSSPLFENLGTYTLSLGVEEDGFKIGMWLAISFAAI